jgi:proteasome-associated ATPase
MSKAATAPTSFIPLAPPENSDELRAWLDLLRRNGWLAPQLFPAFQKLLHDNAELKDKLQNLQDIQESLRAKLTALTEPELYPAIITDVRRNGRLAVEVALANARLDVAVHPDVDPDDLQIGVKARLTQSRNCVVEVAEDPSEWSEIGEFVNWSGGDHIVLRHQGSPKRLRVTDELLGIELRENDLVGFDPNAGIAYAKVEMPESSNLLIENTPPDLFEELRGLDPVIARVKRFVHFAHKYPEVAHRYRVSTKRGILLYGPPGNGKTKLARCLANFTALLSGSGLVRFMAVSGSSFYSMWLGQSEQNIKARFRLIREMAQDSAIPIILFFDEIDAIGRRRGSSFSGDAPDRILATLLAELDGIAQLENVIIIGATNRIDILDPGLIRAGRLGDEQIYIPPPNRSAAGAILLRYLEPLPLDGELQRMVETLLARFFSARGDYADLARVTLRDGRKLPIGVRDLVNGAMLENAVRKAADTAADREIQTGAVGVTLDDVAAALDQELRSVASLLSPGNVRSYVSRLPQDVDPVAVELVSRLPSPSLYVRNV